MRYCIKSIGLLILLFQTSVAFSSSVTPGKVISGWVEKVSFGSNDIIVKAKLDTGAKTSSIFAKNIKKYKQNGDNWVDFTLTLKDKDNKLHEIQMSAPPARKVRIKNHDGDHDRRVVVELSFCFDGRSHLAEFTLADRSEYIYPILLGREFLQEVAIVDPSATFLTKATCQNTETLKPKTFGNQDE